VAAPDVQALITKLELTKERFDGFNIPDSAIDGIIADLRRIETPAPALKPSTLLTLHARWEAAMEEHNRIDEHHLALRRDEHRSEIHCSRGIAANQRECGALRLAILYQVPDTNEELAILSYHAWSVTEAETEQSDEDRYAIEAAITSIFDFTMSAEGF
jgi:hypothetical protein